MRQSHELYVSISLMADLHTNTNTKNLVSKIKQQQLCPWIPHQDNFARWRHTFVAIEEEKKVGKVSFWHEQLARRRFSCYNLGRRHLVVQRALKWQVEHFWQYDYRGLCVTKISSRYYLAWQTFSRVKCFENGKLNVPTNVIIVAFVRWNLRRSKVP